MYSGKDNLVLNKTLLLLGIFFLLGNVGVGGRGGATLAEQTRGSLLSSVTPQTALGEIWESQHIQHGVYPA